MTSFKDSVRAYLSRIANAAEAAIPAGTALIGKVGIDQVTANANEVVVKTSALPSGGSTAALQTALAALIGEVQASPTENTVLDRLKDVSDRLPAAGGETPVSGAKIVTSAGTQVAVGGAVAVRGLIIIADPDNGGNIYVGPSTVDSSTGVKLPPGGILPCGNVNLSAIYIDSDVSGEGISYYYTI